MKQPNQPTNRKAGACTYDGEKSIINNEDVSFNRGLQNQSPVLHENTIWFHDINATRAKWADIFQDP